MQELDDILRAATAAIAPNYFLLPIAGGTAIFRERVYCYELYHQMRSRWPRECRYCLNGEVDKGGHPVLGRLLAAGKKPDLLVHGPGYMELNHTIIEVKAPGAKPKAVKKDLDTLSSFVTEAEYKRAIYLIYGATAESTVARLQQLAATLDRHARVELWAHARPGEAAALAQIIPATL